MEEMIFPYCQSFLHAEGVSKPSASLCPPFLISTYCPVLVKYLIYWVYLEGGPGHMSPTPSSPLSFSVGCRQGARILCCSSKL